MRKRMNERLDEWMDGWMVGWLRRRSGITVSRRLHITQGRYR